MSYLPDASTWIAFLRWQNPGVIAQLKQYPANNLKLIDELAARYASLPFDNAAARHYAAIQAHLTTTGQPIGPNDLMIAALAQPQGSPVQNSTIANRYAFLRT